MDVLREVVESLVRLAKSEIHPGAVLVCSEDVFEITSVPSIVLQGPTPVEDAARRTPARQVRKSQGDLTYEERRHPRLYHLDFDLVVTTGKESELLDLTEKIGRFYQLHPTLALGEHGSLAITELVPVGGLKRVNLSNLRQASGRCRIEDCPVYDGRVGSGKLATGLKLELGHTGE